MEKNEPAYTPKSEYMCRDSDTHYQGCQCHEARWQKRISELEAERDRLRSDRNLLLDTIHSHLNTEKENRRDEQPSNGNMLWAAHDGAVEVLTAVLDEWQEERKTLRGDAREALGGGDK